jgi:hypothetical protein
MPHRAPAVSSTARRVLHICGICSAFWLVFLPSPAAGAEPCASNEPFSPCFEADPLWLPLGPATFATLSSPHPYGERHFGLQLGASLVKNPVTLVAPSQHPAGREVPVVELSSSATFVAGFGLLPRLDANVALPFVIYQSGTGVEGVTSQSGPPIRAQALRDPRVSVVYALVDPAHDHGFAAGVRFELALPVGDAGALAGAASPTLAPGIAAAFHVDRFTFATDVSVRLRKAVRFGNVERGSELATGFGASARLFARPLLATGVELSLRPNMLGAAPGDPARAFDLPAEWLASVRLKPCGDDGAWTLVAGGGAALPLSSARTAGGERESFAGVTAPSFRAVALARYEGSLTP